MLELCQNDTTNMTRTCHKYVERKSKKWQNRCQKDIKNMSKTCQKYVKIVSNKCLLVLFLYYFFGISIFYECCIPSLFGKIFSFNFIEIIKLLDQIWWTPSIWSSSFRLLRLLLSFISPWFCLYFFLYFLYRSFFPRYMGMANPPQLAHRFYFFLFL